ncbi:MAG: hypothetical protein Q9159_004873 [Coniocarpon cinnabarinum]
MPLRAKIQAPMASSRRAVQHEAIPREFPGDELDDVLFNSHFGVRTVELNRPKKLNSLDGSMCRKIIPRLLEWEKSDMISAVIMKGAGEKALCAGGDVAALATWNQEGPEGRQRSIDYFALEYKLDHLIATYTKPYIAFMDGITMGGGVGLSVHAPFRIATERTTFAMPETTIGFFPEVGGSFFLPRLDGQLDYKVFKHTTHYVHSSSLPDLESRLAELTIPDYASLEDRWKIIDNTIAEYVSSLPRNQPIQLAGERRKAIDRCFAPVEIEEVFDRLEEEAKSSSTEAQWAQKTIDTMQGRSPTSLKVTLQQMSVAKDWSIMEAFRKEHSIASRFMQHPDFVEGVSARLIRKPPETPKWQPSSIAEVSAQDVQSFFSNDQNPASLELLRERSQKTDYKNYPHFWTALPKEDAVKEFVESLKKRQTSVSKDVVKQHFHTVTNARPGLQAVLDDILARKTEQRGEQLLWLGEA